MTIEEKVYAALNVAGVTAICPAARIKPDGVYQTLPRPYIKHFAVALGPTQTHSGMAALKNWGYQISMFADSISSLTSLRTAVIAALEASTDPKFFITGMVQLDGTDSPDTPVIGQALILDAWYE
jgi:hypothetical protein